MPIVVFYTIFIHKNYTICVITEVIWITKTILTGHRNTEVRQKS